MVKFSFLIHRLPGMSFEAFVAYHKHQHAPLFMSIPEAQHYVKKYVITHAMEAPGFPKPSCDGITEIWFESLEDYHAFFATQNYLTKVHPDEGNFIDLTNVGVLVTTETVMKAGETV